MALVNQAMAKEKIKPLNLFFENQMKNQIWIQYKVAKSFQFMTS